MLAAGLAVFVVVWGLWFTFLLRYPQEWNAQVDRVHAWLRPYGLSVTWMEPAEKGITLKVIVGATTLVALVCLAMVVRHPTALAVFLKHAHLGR